MEVAQPAPIDTPPVFAIAFATVTPKSTVLAGLFDQLVWVRVEGRGTFQVSAGLKEYTRRMIQRGFRGFVIDLTSCELMDSTFMGTMAGVALRLREIGSGSLTVLHANPRNAGLLENLGLDHLFKFELPDGTAPIVSKEQLRQQELRREPPGTEEQRSTMLSAHEALVEAAPENEDRFRDVLELLKQEPPADSADA